MSDFKSRLELEKVELDEKLSKLTSFLDSDKSDELDFKAKALLIIQKNIMNAYSNVLDARLKLLSN